MLFTQDQETIVAQCTPHGAGAIALLRVSGISAIDIVTRVSSLSDKQKLSDQASHTIHYGAILDNQKSLIDRVMFFLMRAPKTFTGQDTVEITCHNNPFIIQAIIDHLIAAGARLAQEGEFTKRALLNGKIDLIQAEAINELIHAHTTATLKKTLSQLDGSFSHAIETLEKQILTAIALSEASFEFIDEEMTFGVQILEIIKNVLESIDQIKKNFNQQQQIKDGIRIAIIGSVNAGKSSLFNALLGKNRAIVTPIAGTTRDVIEAGIYRNQHYWTLVDTAGLRQTNDSIEQEGIVRSFEQAALADIIVLVFDSSQTLSDQEEAVYADLLNKYNAKIISVYNKSDLAITLPTQSQQALCVSSKTGENISGLEQCLEEKIGQLFMQTDSPFFLNTRQFNVISSLEKKVLFIQEHCTREIAYELLSYHLNDALSCLSELTGKDISEKAMDAIFKEFCVGK